MRSFLQSLLFILVVAATAFYFFGDPKWIGLEKMPFSSDKNSAASDKRAVKGCSTDKAAYTAIAAFEPLDVSAGSNQLPASVSLKRFAPKPRSQGRQGSCVGWATAYAARTITEAIATQRDPNEIVYSPSFLYNQVHLPDCQGTYTTRALDHLQEKGVGLLSDFEYDETDCERLPSRSQLEAALQHRIRGYTRLTTSGSRDWYDVDINALKQHVAQGCAVVIAMQVPDNSFGRLRAGEDLFEPTSSDRADRDSHGAHAMCVVGYDDNKYGGAVQLMNSWSDRWADGGFIWVRYKDFLHFCIEAYAIFPHAKDPRISEDKLQVSFGLQRREGENAAGYIPLRKLADNTFSTQKPLRKGDRFKIELENTKDCYVYIFGLETDGSSYVLFPYEKTSPYFGVTGVRTFPREKSFTVDDLGDMDQMAIVMSKKPLDAEKIAGRIRPKGGSGGNYEDWVTNALGGANRLIPSAGWKFSNERATFDGDVAGKSALLLVIQVPKR